LGNRDLSLVPLPAAMMATAIRGPVVAPEPEGGREEVRLSGEDDELPLNFFIRPNIPRGSSNGYCAPHNLKFCARRKNGGARFHTRDRRRLPGRDRKCPSTSSSAIFLTLEM